MSSKRRLSGQEEEEENVSTTPEPGRKRKKLDPAQQMQAVFDFVRKYKKADGSELCESMIRVPKRRTDPEYYQVVDNPIDILKIQQKLKTDEYTDMEELRADFSLMVSNTKLYYKRGSAENRDAAELDEIVTAAVSAVVAGDDPSMVLSSREVDEDLTDWLEELFGAVMTAVDAGDGSRVLNLLFQLLPSQRRYPEYYKVTTNPLDLKTIATRIKNGKYLSLQQLEDDLQIMFKNAWTFNEPGSQIYKDARTLSKIVKTKRQELDASRVAQQNRGSRSSRRAHRHRFSEQVANLPYEDSDSESESDTDMTDDKQDDPLWQLYTRVRTYTTGSGVVLAEPFLSLPSKRELPDYYVTVTDPISLNMIKRKLREGEYSTLQDLVDDLDKMFDNCKLYNRPDSRLYKEAVKLQKVVTNVMEELESGDEDEDNGVAEAASPVPPEEVKKSPKDTLRGRLKILYDSILYWANSDNIQPIGPFMEKPKKTDYPDYYEIISQPIDMKMIEEKILNNMYPSEEELIQDLKLMFSNCRQYNEEGSAIYEDANLLERILLSKAREMGVLQGRGKRRKGGNMREQIKSLYDTLKDYRDAKGRQLSLIFLKLPNKHDYPDYYEVIKRPIDLEKISSKIRASSYDSVEDCLADVTLVFDNACKYNEPDSQIYKDALALRRLAHQTVRHLMEEEGEMGPDAKAAVLDILSDIFNKTYNHQDGEERFYVDSLSELPDHDEVGGKKVRALSLEIVKRRLDRGLYKRLDVFQQHVFSIFERARKLSRTDSQVFEDAVELQKVFITTRDQMCGGGRVLQSPALRYTQDNLASDIASSRDNKMEEEKVHAEEERGEEESIISQGSVDWSGTTTGGQQYHVGEFVYVKNSETGMEPHIFYVIRLFEKDGAPTIYANQFFRQNETFHVPTRKFLEKEVMRGDIHLAVPVSDVLGKCYVMSVKDYFRYRPDGYDEKDIFVCEHKYASKVKSWSKVKRFWDPPDHIKIVQRPAPLEPKRVASVFKDRIEKHKDEIEELEQLEKTVEEEVPANIRSKMLGSDESLTYWDQYTIQGPITLRRGDHVLVRAENNKNMIAQIDTMWTGQDGMAYFHGPWFVTPPEIAVQPGRSFYKNEAFLSTISDSNPLLAVVGKCSVLEPKDYCLLRPTHVNETDVHLCESVYDEGKRLLRQLAGGLKKYDVDPAAVKDEIYFFSTPITPEREAQQVAPVKTNTAFIDFDNEDSLDAPPSVGSVDSASPAPSKKKMPGKKTVTPYILFSADVRRMIMDENPGVSFGQVSKIVGERWKKMTDQEKEIYEEKSKRVNAENAIKFAEEQRLAKERERQAEELRRNPPPPVVMSPGPVSRPHPASSPLAQRPRQDSGGKAAAGAGSEPLFHTVPPRQPRLLHSEAYIRYIEGLNTESHSMCNWDRQLGATKETVRAPDEAKLPSSWLADTGEHATSVDALWALRDFMLQEALGVVKII